MTTRRPANIHGTAIVVEATGFIFLGPSGSGKSSMAFDCIVEAGLLGLSAALVPDDRVLVSQEGPDIVGSCPPSIEGLIEIRGTGIVRLAHVPRFALHYAILPVDPARAERMPEEHEQVVIGEAMTLPVIRVANNARHPLAVIRAKIPLGTIG